MHKIILSFNWHSFAEMVTIVTQGLLLIRNSSGTNIIAMTENHQTHKTGRETWAIGILLVGVWLWLSSLLIHNVLHYIRGKTFIIYISLFMSVTEVFLWRENQECSIVTSTKMEHGILSWYSLELRKYNVQFARMLGQISMDEGWGRKYR